MRQDFHLHTLVSDGDLAPPALVSLVASHGVKRFSITDHDSLGAYAWGSGIVFEEAARLGLDLVVGIELDTDLDGFEVHVLGLEIDAANAPLREHLGHVATSRAERARREIGIVNELLGAGTITESEIFAPGRETLMKPHFIHPLLEKGRFQTYEEANAWFRQNVRSGIVVPKLPMGRCLELIQGAGGRAVLAHPGYYEKSGRAVLTRLGELQRAGLDGVEADYPYHACSPHLFTPEEAARFVQTVKEAAKSAGLSTTRGSDAHTEADLDRAYNGPWGSS